VSELTVQELLETRIVRLRDVACRGTCRHASEEECARETSLAFPYRGVYVRHVGREQVVAEANQVVFFNAGEPYRVSHPVAGGDANLTVTVAPGLLAELAPRGMLRDGDAPAFTRQRLRIDARAQALAGLLRHSLKCGTIETLEAETLALTLVRRAIGERTAHVPGASAGRRKLVDRAKVALASDVARRWTLAEIASAVGTSPVYLTQVFRQVEGLPLYRYQLRLRLARAIERLADDVDLTTLALDLGFSSQSHFTAAFRQAYGSTPGQFRASTGLR